MADETTKADSGSVAVKDKYLALAFCVFLMLGYFFLLQNAFIENVILFMVGVLGGLLRASSSPQTNVQQSDTTNVTTKES